MLDVTNNINTRQIRLEHVFSLEDLETNVTL